MSLTKRLLLCTALWLAACLCLKAQPQSDAQRTNTVRIMSYNIHHGAGMDDSTSIGRLADVICRHQPEVVAVQEADSANHRSGGRYNLGDLAAEALYYPTFAPAIPFGGGKYGVGILSREKPLAVRHIPLPGSEEKRVMLVAEFQRYVVACVHLSLTEADRMASAALIRCEAARYKKPFLLAGDWNDTPESAFVKEMAKDFQLLNTPKQFTYPADKPDRCIDYIALYKPTAHELAVKSASVPNEPAASDHRPVVATLQFKIPAHELIYEKPYLQNPTPSSVSILFQTRGIARCWVEYGTDTLHLKQARTLVGGQEPCNDIENKIRLDSLIGGKTYYYRVCAQEIIDYKAYSKTFGHTAKTPFHSFRLPTADGTDFTALVMNDLHDYRATIQAFGRIADTIPHDFVLFNGDCLLEPKDRQHAMRILHTLTNTFCGESCPLFFIRGNHEIRNAYSAGQLSLLDPPGGNTYGTFSWGDTRFVMLDCGEDKPDDHWAYSGLNDFTEFRLLQIDFLKQEQGSKAFRKAERRILLNHIPLWGLGEDYIPCRPLWMPLLEKGRYDLNISAHTHRHKMYRKGEADGNPFPLAIGGGPRHDEATLLVLTKKGRQLTLRALNTSGMEISRMEL